MCIKTKARKTDFDNFHHRTFCNWSKITKIYFENNIKKAEKVFISSSGSKYFQLNGYIYRASTHWKARIVNCSWLLNGRSMVGKCLFYGRAKIEDFLEIEDDFLKVAKERGATEGSIAKMKKALESNKYFFKNK